MAVVPGRGDGDTSEVPVLVPRIEDPGRFTVPVWESTAGRSVLLEFRVRDFAFFPERCIREAGVTGNKESIAVLGDNRGGGMLLFR